MTKEQSLANWISESHTCKNCGNIMTKKYGQGIFCCANCRAVYNNKHREKLKEPIICESCGREFYTKQGYVLHKKHEAGILTVSPKFIYSTHTGHSIQYYQRKKKYRVCAHCGTEFLSIPNGDVYDNGLGSKTKFCSVECRDAHRHKVLSDNAKQCHKVGKMKSFPTRDNLPKSEAYWMDMLSNYSIPFEHDYRCLHNPTDICSGHWFLLDFLVYKGNIQIDLELDGKQHKYEDRKLFDVERNRILEELGYLVYRIDISKTTQDDWENQFNEFLVWYNNI